MPALHHESDDKAVVGKIKEELIQRIGSERFDLWFERGVEFRLEADMVVVEVAGEFALQRLRTNYFRQIESAVAQAKGGLSTVRMLLASEAVPASDAIAAEQVQSPLIKHSTSSEPSSFRIRSNAPSEPRRMGAIGSTAIDARRSRAETGRPVAGRPQTGQAEAGRPTVGRPAAARLRSVVTPSPKEDAVTGEDKPTPSQGEAMTFANFAPGTSNRLAHTAAQLLTAQPGDAAPICFWGATGTGKTHLLNAIRHELRHRHRMQRVILLSAEDFTNDFLTAVRGAGLPAFRKRYRDVDALLIDNIQFFGGKSATLREVLYTVDTIISRRRPLVLAGDRPPMEIEGFSGELAGRMSSGLVCGLNPLEMEVRCELLRRESLRSFMPWDEETIQSLALRVGGDGRLIQGIGRLVSMLQRMYRRMPTMPEILREAGDLLQRGPRSVALADIERAVCSAFNLPTGELRGDTKSRNVSQPRILAMYLARQHTSAAYSEIGRYFGDRNHSTVIAAYRRTEAWLKTNECVGGRGPHGLKVKEAIDTVENLLRIG